MGAAIVEHRPNRTRKDISEQCLKILKRNVQDFWRRLVTVDKIWIHPYTPETKQQWKQWVAPGESPPKQAKTVSLARKVIIYKRVKQATGEYYAKFLSRSHEKLRPERPKLEHKNPFSSRQRTGSQFH